MSTNDPLSASKSPDAPSLREKAEAVFQGKSGGAPDGTAALTPEATEPLLHELRVHQIELEMQNEELRRAQVEIEASRARYFDLYDLAPVAYLTLNQAGLIVEANLTAAKLLGVVRAGLINLPLSHFIVPEDQDAYYHHRRQLPADGCSHECELRIGRHDGAPVWARLLSLVAQDEDGSEVCRVVMTNITDQKQAEACRAISSDVLRIFLETGDLQTSLQRILATLKTQTGFEAVGIRLQQGDDFPYFVQEGFPERFLRTENSLLERTAEGGICRDAKGNACLECTCGLVLGGRTDPANPLFTKGGSCWTNDALSLLHISASEDPRHHPRNQCIHHGYATVALIPIRSGEGISGLIQLNDRRPGRLTLEALEILEGVAALIGEALLRKKAEIERNEALLRAEAEARAKNDFLAVMSHELRTPLNGVLGFADLLGDTPLNDEQRTFTETIISSGRHLLSLVNDVLDYASMEHGTLVIEAAPVVVADLAKGSWLPVVQPAADKGIELRTEVLPGVPESICADARRVRQILLNLLNNAVKFTPKGAVVLRIAPSAEAGRECLDFSVEDSGPGIPSGLLDRLFQPFTQADAKLTRVFGGCGLGLSISKRLAEAMGGSLTVVSTQGQGSTFTFRLPLASGSVADLPPKQDEQGPRAATSPVAPLVLVVDDDEVCRRLAGKTLQALGLRAEFAADGAEAVRSFSPGRYSAILMDVSMPRLDGLGATAKIREMEFGTRSHVPIIAFTANVMPGGRERCLAAGMDDFLSKPFKRDELASKLDDVVRKSKEMARPRAS